MYMLRQRSIIPFTDDSWLAFPILLVGFFIIVMVISCGVQSRKRSREEKQEENRREQAILDYEAHKARLRAQRVLLYHPVRPGGRSTPRFVNDSITGLPRQVRPVPSTVPKARPNTSIAALPREGGSAPSTAPNVRRGENTGRRKQAQTQHTGQPSFLPAGQLNLPSAETIIQEPRNASQPARRLRVDAISLNAEFPPAYEVQPQSGGSSSAPSRIPHIAALPSTAQPAGRLRVDAAEDIAPAELPPSYEARVQDALLRSTAAGSAIPFEQPAPPYMEDWNPWSPANVSAEA